MALPRSIFARALGSVRNRGVALARRIRALRLRALAHGGLVVLGRDPSVGRAVTLTIYGELVIGDHVLLDDGCLIYVGPNARVTLGDRVSVGRGAVIAAAESIAIGDHVLIAEHCTVRDSNHHLRPEERRHEKVAESAPVVVAADTWIGAGARVLKGAQIGPGSVIGANAVVRGPIPPRSVAVGIPARVVRTLD